MNRALKDRIVKVMKIEIALVSTGRNILGTCNLDGI